MIVVSTSDSICVEFRMREPFTPQYIALMTHCIEFDSNGPLKDCVLRGRVSQTRDLKAGHVYYSCANGVPDDFLIAMEDAQAAEYIDSAPSSEWAEHDGVHYLNRIMNRSFRAQMVEWVRQVHS